MSYQVGVPHFKGVFKSSRTNNSLKRATLDIIDNIIFLCNKIKITISVNSSNEKEQLLSIKFSDNYEKGFEKINSNGEDNPFNMSHVRGGHDDDSETSEFGIGFKLASMFLGDQLDVYTKVDNEYYKVCFRYDKMNIEPDPQKSYEPEQYKKISKETFYENHPVDFENGSTIEVSRMNDSFFISQDTLIKEIIEYIQYGYSNIMRSKNVDISIVNDNGEEIKIYPNIDFFELKSCKKFLTTTIIEFTEKCAFTTYECFDFKGNRKVLFKHTLIDKLNSRLCRSEEREEFIKKGEHHTLKFTTTFLKFCNQIIYSTDPLCEYKVTKEEFDGRFIPHGKIEVYRTGRKYDQITYKKKRTNGSQNYTIHKIEYDSKKLNKFLGMRSNKSINQEISNLLTAILAQAQTKHEKNYTSDTSLPKFKILEERAMKYDFIKLVRDSDNGSSEEVDSESTTPEPELPVEPEPEPELEPELPVEPEPEPEPELPVEPEPEPEPELPVEPEPEPEPELPVEPEPEDKVITIIVNKENVYQSIENIPEGYNIKICKI